MFCSFCGFMIRSYRGIAQNTINVPVIFFSCLWFQFNVNLRALFRECAYICLSLGLIRLYQIFKLGNTKDEKFSPTALITTINLR